MIVTDSPARFTPTVTPAVVVKTDPWLATSNRNELRAKILAVFDAGATCVVVDCRATGYIDTATTGMFLSLTRCVEARGLMLALSHLSPETREVYRSQQIDTRLRIVEAS